MQRGKREKDAFDNPHHLDVYYPTSQQTFSMYIQPLRACVRSGLCRGYWCFLCLLALLLFLGEYFDGGRDLETCRFYGLSWIALGISGKPKINIIRIRKLFLFLFRQPFHSEQN